MLRYLIEKEFKQLKRNSFLPRLILLFPCMMMLVMPWAATLEIENLRIAVIDNDRSPSSERLVHRIEASRYFQLTTLPPSYAQGLQAIETDQADMLLEIPRGFEKAQANGQSPAALIAVNTVNGTKGGLFTPISSMPEWAQGITYLNPLRYFMETMRMVYLKGSGICDIGFQLSVLSSFAFLLYAWAIRSYRKQQ
ncbi:ABC transporter permease [Phocaeicola plebeius]|uniref:ABC transporter permease n=1 Tax=Phocaeicola plebeius TaxID=310297 RepID=UPI003996AC3A